MTCEGSKGRSIGERRSGIPPEETKPSRVLTLSVSWIRGTVPPLTLPQLVTVIAGCIHPKQTLLLSCGDLRPLITEIISDLTSLPLVVRAIVTHCHIKHTPQRRGEGTSYKQRERRPRMQTKPRIRARILCISLSNGCITLQPQSRTWELSGRSEHVIFPLFLKAGKVRKVAIRVIDQSGYSSEHDVDPADHWRR